MISHPVDITLSIPQIEAILNAEERGGRIITSAAVPRDLLKTKNEGAYIRHRDSGANMDHRPRRRGDREPWVQRGTRIRYSSAECRPEARGGGPWVLARLLRIRVP